MTIRVLIEGIGGIGGLVAAGLIEAGYDVTLVTHNPEITDSINSRGILILEGSERHRWKTKAISYLSEVSTKTGYDIAFLIMKARKVVQAAQDTISLLKPQGYIATFQNGIVEPDVMKAVGDDRVVPVTVGFGGSMVAPGIYEKTSPGGFHIGEWDGYKSRRIMVLKSILQNVDDVTLSTNMQGVLWSKLAINSTINTLGAITGLTLGELLSSKKVRGLFLDIYREVVEVAEALNVSLEPVAMNPQLLYLPRDASWLQFTLKDFILRLVGQKYNGIRSSTLQSVERGRKSEIDVLNGYVVNQATKLGLDVPHNAAVTSIMRSIDEGSLLPDPSNLSVVFQALS